MTKLTPKKKTKKGSSSKNHIKVSNEVWPLERDILFRPERMKYVRKLIKTDGCVFCKAAHVEPQYDTLCVYQTEYSMVLLNKFPYNSGHILVLPKRHCGHLLKLEDQEFNDLQQTLKKVVAALEAIYQPGGINIGVNHGAVAGAGIPDHLHYHVIPRWAGDLNFFPLIAETKVMIETLEQTYKKLSDFFKNETFPTNKKPRSKKVRKK